MSQHKLIPTRVITSTIYISVHFLRYGKSPELVIGEKIWYYNQAGRRIYDLSIISRKWKSLVNILEQSKMAFCAIMETSRCGFVERKATRSKERSMDGDKILYIEDNLENRILVKRVLEAEGYVVLEADDGPSGLRIAEEEIPALILIDINLPEIDGYEVTTRLRQMKGLSNVPMVALTANVLKGDRERSLEAGCDGYIQKPIDVDLLPAQIEAFLRQTQRR
jgi:two-component system cell cycle response regulator DivK